MSFIRRSALVCTRLQRKTVQQHLTLLIRDLRTVYSHLFEQTSTIGYQNVQRKVMTRTFETQQTSLGEVKVRKTNMVLLHKNQH